MERDAIIDELHDNLICAQQRMKKGEDKFRSEVDLEVGELVFVKLQPYGQQSVTKRDCVKLPARHFGLMRWWKRMEESHTGCYYPLRATFTWCSMFLN